MKLLGSLISAAFAYSGQSFEEYGVLHLNINGFRVGRILQNFTENYELDWLEPHSGPTFDPGTPVSILARTNVLTALSRALDDTTAKYTVNGGLDQAIENSMQNTKGMFNIKLMLATFEVICVDYMHISNDNLTWNLNLLNTFKTDF